MRLIFCCAFLSPLAWVTAQSPIGCFHVGGSSTDGAWAILRDPDDSLLIAGYSESFGGNAFDDTYLVRTDGLGTLGWANTIDAGLTTNDFTASIIATTDGGYMLAGSASGNAGVLTKLDAGGAVLWCKSYDPGGPGSQYFNSVVQTDDGGYVAAGVGSITTNATLVMKVDANGDEEWSKLFGYSGGSQQAFAVIEAADSGFVVVGQSPVDGIAVHRLDDDGTLMWAKAYGGDSDLGNAVVLMPDSGFTIAGRTGHFGFGNSGQGSLDAFLVRIDKLGALQWARTFGDTLSEQFEDLTLTQDGGFAMTGFITAPPIGVNPRYAYVAKCDSDGIGQWALRCSPNNNPTQGLAMLEGSSGALSVAGTINVSGNVNVFLLGLEADGTTCPECGTSAFGSDSAAGFTAETITPTVFNAPLTVAVLSTVEFAGGTGTAYCTTNSTPELGFTDATLHIVPNPFRDVATIEIPTQLLLREVQLEVRDLSGRVVLMASPRTTRYSLDRGSLLPGTYTVAGVLGSGELVSAVRMVVRD